MTQPIFDAGFPWFHIKKLKFHCQERKMVIEFMSGNKMQATHPQQDKFDQIIREATMNLDRNQIEYIK